MARRGARRAVTRRRPARSERACATTLATSSIARPPTMIGRARAVSPTAPPSSRNAELPIIASRTIASRFGRSRIADWTVGRAGPHTFGSSAAANRAVDPARSPLRGTGSSKISAMKLGISGRRTIVMLAAARPPAQALLPADQLLLGRAVLGHGGRPALAREARRGAGAGSRCRSRRTPRAAACGTRPTPPTAPRLAPCRGS